MCTWNLLRRVAIPERPSTFDVDPYIHDRLIPVYSRWTHHMGCATQEIFDREEPAQKARFMVTAAVLLWFARPDSQAGG